MFSGDEATNSFIPCSRRQRYSEGQALRASQPSLTLISSPGTGRPRESVCRHLTAGWSNLFLRLMDFLQSVSTVIPSWWVDIEPRIWSFLGKELPIIWTVLLKFFRRPGDSTLFVHGKQEHREVLRVFLVKNVVHTIYIKMNMWSETTICFMLSVYFSHVMHIENESS